jgi:hypothetical protein
MWIPVCPFWWHCSAMWITVCPFWWHCSAMWITVCPFWWLYCLSFFDLRLFIALLVSSKSEDTGCNLIHYVCQPGILRSVVNILLHFKVRLVEWVIFVFLFFFTFIYIYFHVFILRLDRHQNIDPRNIGKPQGCIILYPILLIEVALNTITLL